MDLFVEALKIVEKQDPAHFNRYFGALAPFIHMSKEEIEAMNVEGEITMQRDEEAQNKESAELTKGFVEPSTKRAFELNSVGKGKRRKRIPHLFQDYDMQTKSKSKKLTEDEIKVVSSIPSAVSDGKLSVKKRRNRWVSKSSANADVKTASTGATGMAAGSVGENPSTRAIVLNHRRKAADMELKNSRTRRNYKRRFGKAVTGFSYLGIYITLYYRCISLNKQVVFSYEVFSFFCAKTFLLQTTRILLLQY